MVNIAISSSILDHIDKAEFESVKFWPLFVCPLGDKPFVCLPWDKRFSQKDAVVNISHKGGKQTFLTTLRAAGTNIFTDSVEMLAVMLILMVGKRGMQVKQTIL